MTPTIRLLALVLFLGLSGCGSNRFDFNQAKLVQVGMTEAELVELLGPPYAVRGRGPNQTFVWLYAHGVTAKNGAVSYGLTDGRVTSLPDIREFD